MKVLSDMSQRSRELSLFRERRHVTCSLAWLHSLWSVTPSSKWGITVHFLSLIPYYSISTKEKRKKKWVIFDFCDLTGNIYVACFEADFVTHASDFVLFKQQLQAAVFQEVNPGCILSFKGLHTYLTSCVAVQQLIWSVLLLEGKKKRLPAHS